MREVKINKDFGQRVSEKIDSFIGIFSPERAYRRKAFRFADKFALRGGYEGAQSDRLRADWVPAAGSADEDLLIDLDTLRSRSRDLNRNDGVAAGITGTMISNIVGSGISPQSRIDQKSLGLSPEAAEDLQSRIERVWERWEPFADSQGRMEFWEIQHLVQRQILENGEVVIIPEMIEEQGRPYFLALNVIESDRLGTPSDKTSERNIRKGVELGSRGQPVAYWICKTHPGDTTYRKRTPEATDYIRYPAFNKYGRLNVLHLYWVKRPGQTRGEPFFAPVMSKFKDLAKYMEAELVAARVGACFALFIQTENAYGAAEGMSASKNSKGQRELSLEPGMVKYLNNGEKVEGFNPNRPGGQFDPFVDKILRFIGAALGLPYELVIKDFSKTNYSSARAAILEARKFFLYQQKWLSGKLCRPTWEMLLDEAYLRGDFDAPDYFDRRDDYVRAKWIAPGWSYIDPENEINAAEEGIKSNISTLADECAAHGKDWEEVMEQRAREEKRRKELGLPESDPKLATIQVGKNKGKDDDKKDQ